MSDHDESNDLIDLVCKRVSPQLVDENAYDIARAFNIVRKLIGEVPIP